MGILKDDIQYVGKLALACLMNGSIPKAVIYQRFTVIMHNMVCDDNTVLLLYRLSSVFTLFSGGYSMSNSHKHFI